jgi:hypothetical protein
MAKTLGTNDAILAVAFFLLPSLGSLVCRIKKLVFFSFGKYSPEQQLGKDGWECMNNETMGHYTLKAIKNPLAEARRWVYGEIVFFVSNNECDISEEERFFFQAKRLAVKFSGSRLCEPVEVQ